MRCWIALHLCTRIEPAATGDALVGPHLPAAALQQPGLDNTAAQRAVASMALGFSPRVTLLDEAVLMDVTGSLRLFGGLARLMKLLTQKIQSFFESNKIQAQLLRAQGATSLIALGRLRVQSSAAETRAFRIADLPLYALSAARPHLGVLERIGCRTWADLLRLPRDGVARRFGADFLQALDRARGDVPDEYEWLVLPEHFEEKLELQALVSHGPALMAGVERLLVNLQAWLLGRQSGICALRIVWHLDKRRDVSPTGELDIRTAQPAQDLRHVSRLISEHLARQKLPAPVYGLSLLSLDTELLIDSAAATGSLLLQERKHGDSAVELVERLSARLGDGQVQVWQTAAHHSPELMQHWVDARYAIKSIAFSPLNKGITVKNRINSKHQVWPQTAEALYPTWLLPEPLKLQTMGNSPVYQGKLVRLTGPQRLEAAEWLLADHGSANPGLHAKPQAIRDYFIYRGQQGSLLWLYSERLGTATQAPSEQRAWYLHGFFA